MIRSRVGIAMQTSEAKMAIKEKQALVYGVLLIGGGILLAFADIAMGITFQGVNPAVQLIHKLLYIAWGGFILIAGEKMTS